ncbi:MAG: hypothetical protein IPK19_10160 [Chloroflexi bacterium]|nr:hypothetical protein [Chloroflexota bacterium]
MSTQAPADTPHANIPKPATPETLEQEWITPEYRTRKAEYDLSRTYFGGEAYPYYDTHIGPGSLALMLGSHPSFTDDSVWYHPCFDDLENALPCGSTQTNPGFNVSARCWSTAWRSVTAASWLECPT